MDRWVGGEGGEGVEEIDAAHLRHHEVEDHDIVVTGDDAVPRLDPIAGAVDVDGAIEAEIVDEQPPYCLVILDD